jgi:hypothetical protein
MPGVCSVGELVHLWQRGVLDDEACGCGHRFSECPFWTDVGERAFGGWDRALAVRMLELRTRVDRTRHVPRIAVPRLRAGMQDALDEYVSVFRRLYEGISGAADATVVVDSSKHPSLAFCLHTDERIDLRVVHVIRDSRGVAYSWTKEVRRPESATGEYMARYSPVRSALLWDGHNVSLTLLGHLGTPTHRLRYEDLVSAPRPALEGLAAFAGIPATPGTFDFIDGHRVHLTPGHTVSGNPMRFRTGSIALRRDDDWRQQLTSHHRRLISTLTLPLLACYGYLHRSEVQGASSRADTALRPGAGGAPTSTP